MFGPPAPDRSISPVFRAVTVYRALLVVVSTTIGVGSLSCVDRGDDGDGTKTRQPASVPVSHEQSVVVPTSRLDFELGATDRLVVDKARVILEGTGGDFPDYDSFYPAEPTREADVGDITVRLDVGESLWSALGPDDGDVFKGRVVVELYDDLGVVARGSIEDQTWTFRRQLRPEVEAFDVGSVQVNSSIALEGRGFLRPSEGWTVAVVQSGTLKRPDETTRELEGAVLPVRWEGRRDRASLNLDPSVLGVQQSSFDAKVRFENRFADDRSLQGSEGHGLSGKFEQSYIAKLEPDSGSRGEVITVEGGGFVSGGSDSDEGMLFRFEGRFEPRDDEAEPLQLQGENAIERVPYRVPAEDEARQEIWYTVEDRELEGLGADPGKFVGSITPVLFDSHGEQEGVPWEGTFRVEPTKQVVYLKYLPAFSKALEDYGLRNVERPIRDRVREVIRRDYADYHVEVREQQPEDVLRYATVELGGPDPTGTRAFGYDNTFNGVAKDTGNLYLADYLGGVSVDAAEEFNNPYGGIFIESFTFFSPTLTEDNPNAHPAFDRILEPFMPELGGRPVRGTEWPEGSRAGAIAEAIHMVGTVIGNTVTHEIGHSMGMTHVPRDDTRPTNIFHNEIPGPFIMDPGSERPFEERAELPEAEPVRFNDLNQEYLGRILPKPE